MAGRTTVALLTGRPITFAAILAICFAPARVLAQDATCGPGDAEVLSVQFRGNTSFKDGELARAIATTPSSWLRRHTPIGLGARRCLDRLEFRNDVFRLRTFYLQRGYYKTRVDTLVKTVQPGAVAAIFTIAEGPPMLIDSLSIVGLDSVAGGAELKRLLTPLRGAVFDKLRVEALRDTVVNRLRNSGYARLQRPIFNYETFESRDRASVTLIFDPGHIARIGRLTFDIQPDDAQRGPAISEPTVRRLLRFDGIREGEIIRQSAMLDAQRDLYQLEAYRHVDIAVAPDSLQANMQARSDTMLTIVVRLSEAAMRSARVGLGWGTIDCFRTQGRLTDLNFLGGARRMELNARLSKIGSNAPICSALQQDLRFSKPLNYYGGATFRPPALFGPRNTPSLTVYSERRSEFKAYLRSTTIGVNASLTRNWSPRTPITFGYDLSAGRTDAEDAVFCQVFNFCTFELIGRARETSTLQVGSVVLARNRTDNPVTPTTGSLARFEARYGSSRGGGLQVQFNRLFGELSAYRPIGSSILAGRVQLGGVLAPWSLRASPDFVPAQELFYAGGPNSVRGYNQNQLGPVVYIFDQIDTVVTNGQHFYRPIPGQGPRRLSSTGGNAMFVGNLELRLRSPFASDLLQLAAFVDAGQVWNLKNEAINFRAVKYTPGVGVRVNTIFGPIRVDVGYNPNLLPLGPAYFVGQLKPGKDEPFVLLCVSPGAPAAQTGTTPTNCPDTFRPPQGSGFFQRLTYHFSIGNAF